MIRPGRIYVGATMRLVIQMQDDDLNDLDPPAISIQIRPPSGGVIEYTYGDDDEILRGAAGEYACDFVVTESGRWHYRWTGTGSQTLVDEGNFVVTRSRVLETVRNGAYGRY